MSAVDTTLLPPAPTGAAADFARAHAASHPLKLYGGWFCPFVQRAWIVLHELGLKHQYIEVNPYHKAPEFLALNPRGLIPTLAVPDDLPPLYESAVICEFLDEAYGEEGDKALLPRGKGVEGAYDRAHCRLWIDHVGGKIVPAFYRLLQHTPGKEYTLEDARGNLRGHILTFTREMMKEDTGPWFLGERFSLVDVMLAPWAKRLFLIDHYKDGGTGIPGEGMGGEDEEVWKRWRSWFEAVRTRPSVLETWSDDEMYIKAYKRYADDTTQSEVAKATRRGEKLP
ncbi:glutathione S-transferase [Xylaria sp. CBS 124048]|nr:glutathione S-transferase [Xylaria sp. CBS 124048]